MYKAIMLPIDLGHDSSWSQSLPMAKTLAKQFGAKLHVISVVQETRGTISSQFFPKDYEDQIVRKAATELTKLVKRELSDLEVETHIRIGTVYREIVLAAKKHGCDLIVMASHRPELTDLLISPNAAHVVRHSDASVMVVR